MNTPTFKEQSDKIIQAYFEDKIKPMDRDFCFCGTLAGNTGKWCASNQRYPYRGYSAKEYVMMEDALLNRLKSFGIAPEQSRGEDVDKPGLWIGWIDYFATRTKEYEDALFQGMSDALDVLKEIHESRGEKTDAFEFKKRELVNH